MKKLLSQSFQKITLFICWICIFYNADCQLRFRYLNSFFAPKSCKSFPIITCPPDFSACPGVTTLPYNTGIAKAEPGGPGCSSPVLSFKDTIISSGPCAGAIEIKRTWCAIDPQDKNLISTCIQFIILSDNLAPEISNCPTNINVKSGADCKANVNWSAPSVSDNCGKLFLTTSHISGDAFPLGITTVSYTAEDLCGNKSICTFNIKVEGNCCKTKPNIICPSDYSGCIGDSILPHLTGIPKAAPGDTLCSFPVIAYSDSSISSGPCVGAFKVIRTWQAFDPYDGSLSSTCQQTIELSDTLAPIIANMPTNLTVSPGIDCKAKVSWIEPTVTDNCGIKSIEKSQASGSSFSTGTTTVNYIITDYCNNTNAASFDITVTSCCTNPPSIICPLNFVGCPGVSIDPSSTGFAVAVKSSSECGEPLISYIDSVLNYSCPGSKLIYRKWKAEDPNNSKLYSSCTQLIELKDQIQPEFKSCPANITVNSSTLDCKAIVQWATPIAKDNCTQNVTITSNYASGTAFPIGITIIIITATDECGNAIQHTFSITVINNCCNNRPIIICPLNYIGCPTEHCNVNISGNATAMPGNVGCPQPIISYKDSLINIYSNCPNSRKFIRIWKASDPQDSNNYSFCHQLIDLVDKSPPIWTNCPSNITLNAEGKCDKQVFWIPPVASDNCSTVTLTSNHQSGDIFYPGVTLIVYTAKDVCGNSIQHQFTVTIIGNGLEIECPAEIVVDKKEHYGTVVNWNLPKVKTCGDCKDSLKGFINMGSFNGSKYFCSGITTSWAEAKAICESLGGTLLIINSKDENDYIKSKLMGTTAWIGLHDSNVEGMFEWIDNSPLNYLNWYPGQPNNANGDQDYVEILPDGTWNDQYGKNCYREFICEIPCYTIKQIEGPSSGSLFKCGTTRITYVAYQGNANDTCSFNVTVKCNGSNYCESYAQSCGLMWIKNVSLANINNTSGSSQNGYTYYPSPCIELKWGKTYDLCLTPGFSNQIYNVYWKVWIDYNGDGDFMDQDEFVAYGAGSLTLCGKLTTPWSCMCPVTNTRMRVAMSYGSYPGNSCCVFAYGEVEDYCVNLSQGNFVPSGFVEYNKSKEPIEIYPSSYHDFDSRISSMINDDFKLIPNPAQTVVNILFHSETESIISIYHSSGKLVMKSQLSQINNQIDVSAFSEGMYLVVLESFSGQKLIRKLSVIR